MTDPLDDTAPTADALEQTQDVVPPDGVRPDDERSDATLDAPVLPLEATDADVAEQAAEVPLDEDEQERA